VKCSLSIGFQVLLLAGFGMSKVAFADDSLQFKVNRAIVIQKISGQVFRLSHDQSTPANVGDKLQRIGDGIRTGSQSQAVLALDTKSGTLELSADTILSIKQIETSPKGGHITRLALTQGQVRVKLKTLLNPESKFEIQTPSSVSGVRGTVFGVAVQPTGDTAIAIESGHVIVVSHDQSLNLFKGETAFIPIVAQPIRPIAAVEPPSLSLAWLTPIHTSEGSQVRIAGATSPLNLLQIAHQTLAIDHQGAFDYQVPLPQNRRIPVVITTPLGSQRHYELVVS
jgi:hypothetical protein